MTHFLTLTPIEKVFDTLRDVAAPLAGESIALLCALGRTTAEAVTAHEDVPGFDRSVMDGYAVRAKDVFAASEGLPALLDLVGECPMGQAPTLVVGPGQAARIWTGGMMPEGADAVVMLEYSRPAGEGRVELTRPVGPGEHVLQKGEDAAVGQTLIPAGRVLRPQEIGLLAALGQETVLVRRKPRVAVISTGDEVVPVSARPAPGQVRDVNTYTLCALVEAAGAEAAPLGLVDDDAELLGRKSAEALASCDVLLLSGGSSAGKRDFSVQVLGALPGAEILLHGVNISPGKPLILGRSGAKILMGLPGHVAGALVTAELFVRFTLDRLLGRSEEAPPWSSALRAKMTRSVASAQGRRDYIRVALLPPENPGEPLRARPILGKSGLISTMVEAHGLVACPEEQEGLREGEERPVHLLV